MAQTDFKLLSRYTVSPCYLEFVGFDKKGEGVEEGGDAIAMVSIYWFQYLFVM